MILLDTDHLTVLQIPDSKRRERLVARMALTNDTPFLAPIIGVEEQMKGWLAAVAKERAAVRQVKAYRELEKLFAFYAEFELASFNDTAAVEFDRLRSLKLRVSTMDLKIASIALVNNATLLTANRQDYERVPGLRFENWMD